MVRTGEQIVDTIRKAAIPVHMWTAGIADTQVMHRQNSNTKYGIESLFHISTGLTVIITVLSI